MGKDRSKKLAVKWSTNFFLEKSGRTRDATAGVRGTDIRVTVAMDEAVVEQSRRLESLEQMSRPGSIWEKEMTRVANEATVLARYEWNIWRDEHGE